MTTEIDESDSSSDIFNYVDWALETGIWNGRPVSWMEASEFRDEVQMRVFSLLFEKQNSPAFERFAANLAWLGTPECNRDLLAHDIQQLDFSKNGLVLQAGLGKDLSKFWKKHKKEIIIGAAVVAAVTVVIVVAVSTAGAGAGAAVGTAAALGAKLRDDLPTPKNLPQNESTAPQIAQSEFPSLPALADFSLPGKVIFGETGIIFDGKYTSYNDILQDRTSPSYYPPEFQLSITDLHAPSYDTLPHQPEPSASPLNQPQQLPLGPERKSWINTFLETIGRNVIDSPDLFENVPAPKYELSEPFVTPGKRDSWIGMSSIHGMATTRNEAIDHANHLSKFSKGYSVDWIYNNSHGIIGDFLEIIILNLFRVSPNTSRLLAKSWTDFHEANRDRPHAKFLQFCFSQGSIHVRNALENLPKEVRDRVMVIALGTPVIIPDEFCYRVRHYACEGDVVVHGEEIFAVATGGILKGMEVAKKREEKLIWIERHPDTQNPHAFQNPAFNQIKQDAIDEYLSRNGEY